MIRVSSNLVQAVEYCRVSPNDFIRAVNSQEVTLSPEGYHLIRVLVQEKREAPFKVAKDLPAPPKPSLFLIFETSFIESLPWDLGEWHWQGPPHWGTHFFLDIQQGEVTRTQRDYLKSRSSIHSSNNQISKTP